MDKKVHSPEVELAAARFSESLKQYPIEVSVGIGIVLPNLINGCSWGFVNDKNEEFIKLLDTIKANKNMSTFKVKNGYLYNMNMSYLLDILSKTAGGYVTSEDLEIASKHRQKALEDLNKFLAKGGSGQIGIYNLNDSPRITVRGTSFPAFCVTLNDLLAICERNGYGLLLGGQVRKPSDVARLAVQVIEKLEVAPSGNALFISVAKMR